MLCSKFEPLFYAKPRKQFASGVLGADKAGGIEAVSASVTLS